MAKHVVIQGPVEHDGVIYQDGAELSLPDDAAAALVAAGVVEQVVSKATKNRESSACNVQ